MTGIFHITTPFTRSEAGGVSSRAGQSGLPRAILTTTRHGAVRQAQEAWAPPRVGVLECRLRAIPGPGSWFGTWAQAVHLRAHMAGISNGDSGWLGLVAQRKHAGLLWTRVVGRVP